MYHWKKQEKKKAAFSITWLKIYHCLVQLKLGKMCQLLFKSGNPWRPYRNIQRNHTLPNFCSLGKSIKQQQMRNSTKSTNDMIRNMSQLKSIRLIKQNKNWKLFEGKIEIKIKDLDITFINFNCLITIFINYILGNFASMLSNIAVNSQPLPRPESANIPKRIYTNSQQHTLDSLQNCQSSFLNHEKIILPVKEYSNKFLRESKQKQDSIFNSYNHSIFKPKKSFVYNRKQLKYRKPCQAKPLPNKENQTRSIKTQASFLQPSHESYERDKSVRNTNTPMERCFSTPNNKERISASRALELFSRVFKNQNIERLKIRKQIISRQMDVQVKQVKLQDKEKQKQKDKHEKIQKLSTLKNKKLNFHGGILERTKKENKSLFLDQDNFQLAGW